MAGNILIKNVLLDGKRTNVLIEGTRFKSIAAPKNTVADETIDGSQMAILPPFYNTHTHAAMSLLRGYADDLPLKTWLEDHIWPMEDKFSEDDIYEGSRLAIREMIKSGTVFFCDMYFFVDSTIRAVEEMGVRACIGITFLDYHSEELRRQKTEFMNGWAEHADGRINLCAAPHAIYTASSETILYAAGLARKNGMRLTIHLSETEDEVAECISKHGMRPVKYLDSLGILGNDVIAAHCVHIDDEEIEILAKRGVTVAHCPCSNMKLGSGILPYSKLIDAKVRMTLGTDGCSSNNNLDMREEMKFAALLAKCNGKPSCLNAKQALRWATENGAAAFGIDAGVIREGKLADALLVRIDDERFQNISTIKNWNEGKEIDPAGSLTSNWVYSAQSDCIDTVICNGKILMKNRKLLV